MTISLFFFIMFLWVIMSTLLQRTHLLLVLLNLEYLTLTLVLILTTNLAASFYSSHLFIVLLIFGAMEASLGLALLVCLARKTGSDLINTLTMSKC
uniref:NADH-ubiquinone oxidoreductase chain 4L n=1 Tax=Decemunciger sp. AB-2017 TaxID=1980157 RepID=A0A1X9ZNR9_9ANNE|nr:NADH dehydrogenase subunit 4L [Decemunciger sp. AB-2017]ASK06198.1 NADH dehydrogenase subunit 4L [Decemunciger sp. AB-2017]ASK06211.1 NADH dehydrogenase subunit 4L [Decemunciger sp. AB-2017]